MEDEIGALKRVRKNVSSIITTNYDRLIENVFEFNPLIGNNILLSEPYGALYKIHGSVEQPDKIIITASDYKNFNEKYELIRAQLLSLFIHHPIIFIGYNIGDENIKDILKTIFTYVEPNTDIASKIRSNFLLVEYEKDSTNEEVTEHDIDMEGFSTIRINKLKTDNYLALYNAISKLELPVSTMDIRKVQHVVKDIYAGGSIKVSITEDLDDLHNDDKVLVIGSRKTITYTYQTTAEMMANYFNIIDEENAQLIALIDKYKIAETQFFPICGFAKINTKLSSGDKLKSQQYAKLLSIFDMIRKLDKKEYTSLNKIEQDAEVAKSSKLNMMVYSILKRNIQLDEVEVFLKNYADKKCTDYRKLLCAYDYIKYTDEVFQ